MDSKYLRLAAYNNAIWCDTICRSHHVPGEFHETFWVNRHQTPHYYPDLVTLSPTADLTSHQIARATLLTAGSDYNVSVKDSFAVLDLAPFGFHPLFQAQWMFRQAPEVPARQGLADLQWKRIESEYELLRWEAAWSQSGPLQQRLFLPALLNDADICILAAYREQRIVAGAIATRTGEVAGLSNVFTPEPGGDHYWKGLLAMIGTCYPALPVVGYGREESLTSALRVGFTPLGPLRVWIKD
jgi:hypothetical protein